MGKLWDELEEAGIQEAVSPLNPLSASCMSIEGYANFNGERPRMFVLMTGAQVHAAAQEMVAEVEKYRQYNMDSIRHYADQMPPGTGVNTRARIDRIARMSRAEVLVGMPKFIRVCLELLDRGYDLEDMFYDKPH